MADSPALISPKVAVYMSDGASFEVQTLNPDLIRWDITRTKHAWPKMEDAPVMWLTFIGWAALRREGTLPDEVTWERFSAELCVGVSGVDVAEGEPMPGDPFPSGPVPDSSSS